MASYNRRGGGRGRGGRRNRGDWKDKDSLPRDSTSVVVDDSPIVQAFRVFQAELDCRNDRFERIVKISRDITIESKRVIFLLQRVIGSDDPEKVFKEAFDKIQEINTTKFLEIAKELEGQDPYQFLRAYTNGLQEYIEAVTFYYYLTEQRLVDLEKVQNPLIFTISNSSDATNDQSEIKSKDSDSVTPVIHQDDSDTTAENSKETELTTSNLSEKDASVTDTTDSKCHVTNSNTKQLCVHIPDSEYMMGVADFTGELMRMAITSVGSGDLDTPKVVAGMMRIIHNAFSVFDHTSREMRRKGTVLKQSLQKVETACYALTVRGSEIPKHMLTDVFTSSSFGGDSYMADDIEDTYE